MENELKKELKIFFNKLDKDNNNQINLNDITNNGRYQFERYQSLITEFDYDHDHSITFQVRFLLLLFTLFSCSY
jgi:hypothetical protein